MDARRATAGAPARTRVLCAWGSLVALLALAGCGSSASKAPGAASAPAAASSTPAAATTSAAGGGLHVNGQPKYGIPASSQPVLSGVVAIAYREIAIHPDTLRVKAGSTVRWTNYDPVKHNVTSESGPQSISSGDFAEGASFEIRLTRPGILHYRCTIHPASMNGAIEVVR